MLVLSRGCRIVTILLVSTIRGSLVRDKQINAIIHKASARGRDLTAPEVPAASSAARNLTAPEIHDVFIPRPSGGSSLCALWSKHDLNIAITFSSSNVENNMT